MAINGENVTASLQALSTGVRELQKTKDAMNVELEKAMAADAEIEKNKQTIQALGTEIQNITKAQQDIRNAANQAAQAAQQAANAAQMGGGGGGGGGKGGGGGGGRGMGMGVEAAEIPASRGVEFAQPGGDVDVGNVVGAMALEPYVPLPGGDVMPMSAYQPTASSFVQMPSQQIKQALSEARKGLMLQSGAKPGNPIADGGGAAAMAAAAAAAAGGKPAATPSTAGTPGGGGAGGGGDNFSGVGRGEMGDDGGKRPTVLASAEGAAGAGVEGAAATEATVEEEIAPAKGPNSSGSLTASAEKHIGAENPVPQGLMTWVSWVNNVCKSDSGKTLVGVCASGARLAAKGVAPLTTSVAEAMAQIATSTASGRAVASVPTETKAKEAPVRSGSKLLDLVSK